MKMNREKGPALRIRIKNAVESIGETIVSTGDVVMRNAHRLETGLLVYCLIVLTSWCGVRLASAGLPLDTGWGRADRDPRSFQTSRPFRAITALVDEHDIQR